MSKKRLTKRIKQLEETVDELVERVAELLVVVYEHGEDEIHELPVIKVSDKKIDIN